MGDLIEVDFAAKKRKGPSPEEALAILGEILATNALDGLTNNNLIKSIDDIPWELPSFAPWVEPKEPA